MITLVLVLRHTFEKRSNETFVFIYSFTLHCIILLFRYVYWFYLRKDLDDDSKIEDSVIKRAPMYKTDASGEVVLRRDVYVNTHFAIDYSDQKLYWTSATLILRHNLDPDHIKFFKVTLSRAYHSEFIATFHTIKRIPKVSRH